MKIRIPKVEDRKKSGIRRSDRSLVIPGTLAIAPDHAGQLREAFGVRGIPALCVLGDHFKLKSAGMPRTPNASRFPVVLVRSIDRHRATTRSRARSALSLRFLRLFAAIPQLWNGLSAFGFLSAFGLRIWVFFALLSLRLLAAETNLPPDTIPPLRPPRPELPPAFWEQHGSAVVVLGLVLILIIPCAIWLLTRPKLPALTPPVVVARQALQPLSAQPETGAVLSQTSQILHRYLTAAFELPPGELTTTDLGQMLAAHELVGQELATAIGDFLRRTDQRKFAPASALPPLGVVSEALKLIENCEARLQQCRQTAATTSNLPPPAHSAPTVRPGRS